MDNIITQVSKLLSDDYKILIQSKSVTNLTPENKIILWNSEPLKVSPNIYEDFKEAIKKRGSKHYNRLDILEYCDFCVALLCCSNYSLNHNCVPTLQDRTFIAAWRGLTIVSATSNERVSSWINKYMYNRTSEGYQNTFAIAQYPFTVRNTIFTTSTNLSVKNKDTEIINSIDINEKAINLLDNKSYPEYNLQDKSSFTPEGQLDILRTAWNLSVKKIF